MIVKTKKGTFNLLYTSLYKVAGLKMRQRSMLWANDQREYMWGVEIIHAI
jgi:hypothetical protein